MKQIRGGEVFSFFFFLLLPPPSSSSICSTLCLSLVCSVSLSLSFAFSLFPFSVDLHLLFSPSFFFLPLENFCFVLLLHPSLHLSFLISLSCSFSFSRRSFSFLLSLFPVLSLSLLLSLSVLHPVFIPLSSLSAPLPLNPSILSVQLRTAVLVGEGVKSSPSRSMCAASSR